MHPGIPHLIRSDNLKPGFDRPRRCKSPACKLARLPGIFQGELHRNVGTFRPLSPYLEFVRIPETSGSERAPSEHLDFRPDLNVLAPFYQAASGRVQDIHNQPIQFDDDPFPRNVLPGDQSDGL